MASWVQSDLDAINAAIKSGVTKVKYQDKEVTYRSVEEMLIIRDLIRKDLGQTNSTQKITVQFSKGLD
jgi:predicted Co/Zn/Cd cation transporter (cation efflux family)